MKSQRRITYFCDCPYCRAKNSRLLTVALILMGFAAACGIAVFR